MLSPILALFARISKPLWLNIRSTGKFHASWVTKTESSWSQVPRPRPRLEGSKTKTKILRFQDQDQDSEVPRPRPRPRLEGSKTKTKTLRFQDWDQDSSLENSKSATNPMFPESWVTRLEIDCPPSCSRTMLVIACGLHSFHSPCGRLDCVLS